MKKNLKKVKTLGHEWNAKNARNKKSARNRKNL